jgi:hypothetical protein
VSALNGEGNTGVVLKGNVTATAAVSRRLSFRDAARERERARERGERERERERGGGGRRREGERERRERERDEKNRNIHDTFNTHKMEEN